MAPRLLVDFESAPWSQAWGVVLDLSQLRKLNCSSQTASWMLCACALVFARSVVAAEGELVLDYLFAKANTVVDAAQPGSGNTTLDAGDLGTRFLYSTNLSAFGQPAKLQIDYHGRDAVVGNTRNSDLHLFYAANLTLSLDDRSQLSMGRFLAPSVVLLPVDGLRLTHNHKLADGQGVAQFFAGRRGVLTSRRNVPLDEFLPAIGADWQWRNQRFSAGGSLAYSEDDAILVKASQELKRRYGSMQGAVQGSVALSRELTVNLRIAGFEHATVTLGPSWSELDLDMNALDLWHATGMLRWRPNRDWRFRYGFHRQQASVYRVGVQLEDEAGDLTQFRDPGFSPTFTDHRLRAERRFRLGASNGWIRARARYRERADRTERRAGGELQVSNVLIKGASLQLAGFVDQISGRNGNPIVLDGDRRSLMATLGYRRAGWNVEAGANWLDRNAPYSGRTFTLADPDEPRNARDQSLFVLEAQTHAFVRTFWTGRRFFAGLDLERNLEDGGEFRAFAQFGVRFGEGR